MLFDSHRVNTGSGARSGSARTLSGWSTEGCRVPVPPRLHQNPGKGGEMLTVEVVLEEVERFDRGVELSGRFR